MSECPSPSLLIELRSGRLPAQQTALLYAHTAECAACRAKLAELPAERLTPQASAAAATGFAATALGPSDPPAPPAVSESPPAVFEEYRLLRLLGRGAMGQVYLAQDTLLERQVAIKFMTGLTASAEARDRFLVEARAIARLSHANVVTVHRVGQTGSWPFLVSEFIAGTSLDAVPKPVAEPTALRIALELTRGLVVAHRGGVLHRDIKPANVMFTEDQAVKLLDFGLAKLLGDARSAERRHLQSPAAAAESAMVPQPSPEARLTAVGTQFGTPVYMAPEMWRGEPATTQVDLYSVGVLLYELCTGEVPHIARTLEELALQVLEHDAPPLKTRAPAIDPRFGAIVDRCLRRHPADRFPSAEALYHALLRLQTGAEHPAGPRAAPTENPYRGLYSFEAEHWALFFGRSEEIQTLLLRLRAQPFVLVVGDSGVGKSSVCRAGVIPRVQAGALQDGRTWRVVKMFPGKHPLARLSDALAPFMDESAAALYAELVSQPGECMRRLHRCQGEREGLLLFIDQLEEVLTQGDPAQAVAMGKFLAQLLARGPGVRVLCTVRGDFLTRLAELPGLGPELQQTLYLLRALSREGLREAIVGPAEQSGVRFESPELIEELVATTLRTEGGLPLLQFTLAELWDARDLTTQQITREALQKRGGVAGALSRHADRVLDTLLPAPRHAARRLLIKLVSSAGLRLRRPADELLTTDPAAAAALEALVAGRLLVVRQTDGAPVYEIAHEALTSGWPRLREWLSSEAAQREVHERLSRAATDWQRLDQATDALWNDRQLQEVDAVAIELAGLSPREAAFLDRSRHKVRWRRRGRFATWLLVANVAVATGASVYLWSLKEQNRELAAREGKTRRLAEQAERASRALGLAQLPGREISALVELVKLVGPSLRRGEVPLPAALEGLSLAVDTGRRSRVLRGHTKRIQTVAFAPDGQQLLTASDDHSVRLWDTRTGQQLRHLSDAGEFSSFSPDGRLLATASRAGTARLWDTATGAPSAPLAHQGTLLPTLGFSADGQRLATCTTDAAGHFTTWLWDVPARRLVTKLPGSALMRPQAAFSSDSALLLTGEEGQTLTLWDATTGAPRTTLPTPRPASATLPINASFSEDGRFFFATDAKDFWMWDAKLRQPARTFPNLSDHSLWVTATSPDGTLLMTADRAATIRLWDTQTATVRATLVAHSSGVRCATFSPDSRRLITGGNDALAVVWDTATGQRIADLIGHIERIQRIAVAPDSSRIATVSDDNTARLWDLNAGQHSQSFIGHTAEVYEAIYSADGLYVATQSKDSTLRVWEAATGKQLTTLPQLTNLFIHDFSPEGNYLATGSLLAPQDIRIWDWRRGAVVASFAPASRYINSLVFSPDGQTVASPCPDSFLRIWDWRTGKAVWVSDKQPSEPVRLKFSRDGRRFVSSDLNGEVRIWDTQTKRVLHAFTDQPGRTTPAVFSPDGETIAIGGQRARIVEVASGRSVLELVGPLDAVVFMDFSRDGKRVLAVGGENVVRIYDSQTGQQVFILHLQEMASAAFSPDGQSLLVAHNAEHSAKIYPVDARALLGWACALLRYQPEWGEIEGDCRP